MQINQWIHLSPYFQYVWNANEKETQQDVIGLRTQFYFKKREMPALYIRTGYLNIPERTFI
ncbi:MAG: hypothetical protein JW798_10435 [Prolixibacteraceae bacterium]|nr:hypothetical protein [Prolixibacteraceae bacterium]